MMYHVGRGSEPLGQFSAEALREGLETGQFFATDLVWREGMSGWQPLAEMRSLLDETAAAANPSAPPLQGTVLPPAPVFGGHVGMGVMPVPGSAVASLVLGVTPLLFCLIAPLTALAGVICGHMAMRAINTPGMRYEGRGVAMAGLVINYVWLGLTVLGIIIFVLVFVLAGTAATSSA